eukprot:gene15637-biopygen8180
MATRRGAPPRYADNVSKAPRGGCMGRGWGWGGLAAWAMACEGRGNCMTQRKFK